LDGVTKTSLINHFEGLNSQIYGTKRWIKLVAGLKLFCREGVAKNWFSTLSPHLLLMHDR
jgi:hypothetical protein